MKENMDSGTLKYPMKKAKNGLYNQKRKPRSVLHT